MNRKAAEMSLNVVIIAVILLVVLVVLVIIFSGKIGRFQNSTSETQSSYGVNVCDVPGTGRYCSDVCLAGDVEVSKPGFTCLDTQTRGIGKCCSSR